MKMINIYGAVLTLSALSMGQAQAASYTYNLQYNNLGYSGELVAVQWQDGGAGGAVNGTVNFTVSALDPVTWLQEFSFNLVDGILASALTPTLPNNWSYDTTNVSSGPFGKFDGGTLTNGDAGRVDPLSFSLAGTGLSAASFLAANADGNLFAAHVGWVNGYTGYAGGGEDCNPFSQTCGGGDVPTPIPGAIWLFGSAIMGLMGFGARRKSLVQEQGLAA